MSEQLQGLQQHNRQLEQLNSRFAPIDLTSKLRFTELRQLAERVSDRPVSEQLLSRLLRAEEQYDELEQLYDKMLVKYYQSVSASCHE